MWLAFIVIKLGLGGEASVALSGYERERWWWGGGSLNR